MTLVIDDIRINTSIHEFYEGSAKPYQIENAILKAEEFEKTGSVKLILEFMRVVDDEDALFPIKLGVDFCRTKATRLGAFRKNYPVFEDDARRIFEFYENNLNETQVSAVKRFLFVLYTSTTARRLQDVTPDVWRAWLSSMKEPSTQYKEELRYNGTSKRALRIIADYMDAHYPKIGDVGYAPAVKVHRKSNYGYTGKTIDFIDRPPQDFAQWAEILENFKSIRGLKSSKPANNGFRKFASWLECYPPEAYRDPQVFLSAWRHSPSFVEHINSLVGSDWPTATRTEVSFMIRMVDHFIEENMVFTEDGERVELGYPLVSQKERDEIIVARGSTNSHRSQTTSHPLPLKWVREVQKILTEDDWAWPKSLDLYWFTVSENGSPIKVWNPVIPYLVYSMTELPWRRKQFKCLDSGEGDSEVYDLINDTWLRNTSPTAGFWERNPKARVNNRGVISRHNGGFAFYVNTNKTSDRDNNHDETSGYYVPWKHTPMIELLQELRQWQEKYNPLEKPTKYEDVWWAIEGADRPSDKVMSAIPDRFYLFRDIQGRDNRYSPPTDNRAYAFWRLLMDELEKRLRAKGEEATIILSRNKSGGPAVSQFNMHGLRVSGLTAFAEAGVPIEILSKLVAGHASILMTIYYLKYNTAHVTEVLTEARQKVEAIAAKDFGRHLKSKSIEEAMKVAVANEEYTLEGVAAGKISTDQFFDTGIGVCPYNATRCHDGIAESGGRTSPVPGGAKNCLNCRHFITGEPWLMPLVLNQQKIAGKVNDTSREIENLEGKLEELESQRASVVKQSGSSAISPSLSRIIAESQLELERHSLDLDRMLNTMHRAHGLIEAIKEIQRENPSNSLPALVGDASAEMGEIREGTRFELIDTVLHASRIYPILRDDRFEMERRSYIDAIMYHNGLKPLSVMELTEEQKIKAADAASKWLMTKVGAQETQLLISGGQTLTELGYSPDALAGSIQIASVAYPLLEAGE